jgi:hypothetical protein
MPLVLPLSLLDDAEIVVASGRLSGTSHHQPSGFQTSNTASPMLATPSIATSRVKLVEKCSPDQYVVGDDQHSDFFTGKGHRLTLWVRLTGGTDAHQRGPQRHSLTPWPSRCAPPPRWLTKATGAAQGCALSKMVITRIQSTYSNMQCNCIDAMFQNLRKIALAALLVLGDSAVMAPCL